jgi:hypothetical protein
LAEANPLSPPPGEPPFPAAASSGGSAGSTGTGTGNGSAGVGKATTRRKTATTVVTCAGASGTTCTITLSLTVTEARRGGKLIAITASKRPRTTKRTISLGTTTITLNAGQTETAHITLNATGQKLLKSHHDLAVRLLVTSANLARTTQIVTFKEAAQKTKP